MGHGHWVAAIDDEVWVLLQLLHETICGACGPESQITILRQAKHLVWKHSPIFQGHACNSGQFCWCPAFGEKNINLMHHGDGDIADEDLRHTYQDTAILQRNIIVGMRACSRSALRQVGSC